MGKCGFWILTIGVITLLITYNWWRSLTLQELGVYFWPQEGGCTPKNSKQMAIDFLGVTLGVGSQANLGVYVLILSQWPGELMKSIFEDIFQGNFWGEKRF